LQQMAGERYGFLSHPMQDASSSRTESIYLKRPPEELEDIEQAYLPVREHPETHPETQTLLPIGPRVRLVYLPAILACAELSFFENQANFSYRRDVARIVPFPKKESDPDWNAILLDYDPHSLKPAREKGALLSLEKGRRYRAEDFNSLKASLIRHLLQTEEERIFFNRHLKLYSRRDEGLDEFLLSCHEQGQKLAAQEAGELIHKMKTRTDRIRQKEQQQLLKPGAEEAFRTRNRSLETFDVLLTRVVNQYLSIWHDPNIAFPASSPDMEGVREKVKAFFDNGEGEDITVELMEFRDEFFENLHNIDNHYQDVAADVEELDIRLVEKGIDIVRFALLWAPYIEVTDRGTLHLHRAF